MSRLGKRERQARLAFRASRADLVIGNRATPRRPQTLSALSAKPGDTIVGLERELRLLGGTGKLGSGYLHPAMLKGHSLSKGCGASGAGRGSKARYDREAFKLWSEPVRRQDLPAIVLDGQPVWADRLEYAASIRHQQALALHAYEGLDTALPDAVWAIRLVEALAALVKPKRKRKPRA